MSKELPSIDLKNTIKHPKKILHIATKIFKVGGHTRNILNWFKADTIYDNELLVTNQTEGLPKICDQLIREHKITCLEADTYIAKAKKLQKHIKKEAYDLIVLHQHPDDVLPLFALFPLKRQLPILYYDHADHVYWMGASITTAAINFRNFTRKIVLQERGIKKSFRLPFALEKIKVVKSKDVIKKEIGVSDYRKVLITIASSYKFKPAEGYDFFEIYEKFLTANQDVALIVIGLNNVTYKKIFKRTNNFPNLFLMGIQAYPQRFLSIADVFVESFPFGSFLALTEGLNFGLIPLFSYGEVPTICGKGSITVLPERMDKYRANSLEEYMLLLNKSINDEEYITNLSSDINSFLPKYNRPKWVNHLTIIYENVTTKGQESIMTNIDLLDKERLTNLNLGFNKFINRNFSDVLFKALNEIEGKILLKEYIFIIKIYFCFLEEELGLKQNVKNLLKLVRFFPKVKIFDFK